MQIVCRIVEAGYGTLDEVLDFTFDQIDLIASGGKGAPRGIPIASDADLAAALAEPHWPR